MCAYCGDETTTRDHVPSRILLDEPYPENLPVVPACQKCNQGFSMDEEYVACLIECVIIGTTEPSRITREKIRRILLGKPLLADRLRSAHSEDGFIVEVERIRNVVLKLGRGHALYELNEPQFDTPKAIDFAPLSMLSDRDLSTFESQPTPLIFPEVGSRGMQRQIMNFPLLNWVAVQPGRYRYLAFVDNSVVVRAVLSEYLAVQIIWG